MKLSKTLLAGLLALLMVLAPVLQPLHSHAAAAYEVGTMSASGNGWSADGIYATHAASEAPYNNDWSLEYTPVTADAFKLIREGVTYNVGLPGQGTIVKTSATDCYIKTVAWTVGGNMLPLRDGDILVVDGEYRSNTDGTVVDFAPT